MKSFEWNPTLRASASLESESVFIAEWRCNGLPSLGGYDEVSPYHQIWLQRSGAHAVEAEGYRAVAEPGSALLYARGEQYRTRSRLGVLQSATVLFVTDERMREIAAEILPHHDPIVARGVVGVSPRAALARTRLKMMLHEGGTSALELEETAFSMIAAIMRSAVDAPARTAVGADRTTRAHAELVHATQHLLTTRFAEPLLLSDIAGAVGSSPFHLSRVFSRHTGVPLHRYLTRIRLYAALERLATEATDLSRIALDAGFASHSHFTTAFRQAFDQSPAHARALLQLNSTADRARF